MCTDKTGGPPVATIASNSVVGGKAGFASGAIANVSALQPQKAVVRSH